MDYKDTPLWDNRLPIEERIDYVIECLTLEEKIHMMTPSCIEIKRLGITPFSFGGEAAHGIEARHDTEYSPGEPVITTSFPEPIGLSQTFDAPLLKQIGEAIGTEGRIVFEKEQNGGLSRWAPTIDMARDPRWGRTEECYGEDPFLVGTLSSSLIKGMQGEDPFYLRVAATLKHFYANNQEKDRIKTSSSIDPRNKYEYYLLPFRQAIMEGNAEGLMTAYNEINGLPCMLNPEVTTLVKNKWGLKGHVVTDGLDVNQTVNDHHFFSSHAKTIEYGLKAGIDCFTDEAEFVASAVKDALSEGLITEQDLDTAIRRQFTTRIRLGLYEKDALCPYSHPDPALLCGDTHSALAYKAALESLVLLKNDNNMLPLDTNNTTMTIAVIGPLSNAWNRDWYGGLPKTRTTILDGIKNAFPAQNIQHEDAINSVLLQINNKYVGLREDGQIVLTTKEHAEPFYHCDWDFSNNTFCSQSTGCYLKSPVGTGPLTALSKEAFGWYITESFSLNNQEDGTFTLTSWNGHPVIVLEDGQLVAGNYDDTPVSIIIHVIKDNVKASLSLAHNVDTVVVCLGCHPMIGSKEEVDRESIRLPKSQLQLLQALYKENPSIILVLTANYPYDITWAKEHIPAILLTPTGCESLGMAVANALSGRFSPGGRLSMTWYKDNALLPPMDEYDIIQSGRTYQYYKGEPLFPFGYGLSYEKFGAFSYSDLSVIQKEDNLLVTFSVTRKGGVFPYCEQAQDEVVEVYISQLSSRVKRPSKQLKGFLRASFLSGECRQFSFTIPLKELAYYDVIRKGSYLETSQYEISAGPSSDRALLKSTIFISGDKPLLRNPFAITPCSHYDCYQNVYLHLGKDGLDAILPKIDRKEAMLLYKDFLFQKSAECLILSIQTNIQTKLRIEVGQVAIVDTTLPVYKDYESITLPLNNIKASKQPCNIKIKLEGEFRLLSFSFA